MVPSPYDISWTCHLIKRDLIDLKDKGKAKVKQLFGFGKSKQPVQKGADASQGPDTFCVPILTPLQDEEKRVSRLRDQQDKLGIQDRNGSPRENSSFPPPPENPAFHERPAPNNPPVELDLLDDVQSDLINLFADFDGTHCPVPASKSPTFFHDMQFRLAEYYKNRPKDVEHEERWRIRGLVLVLHLALFNCPSNPFYDYLRRGQSCFDDEDFQARVSEHVNGIPLSTLQAKLGHYAGRVSKMPGGLYQLSEDKRNSVHYRIDSLMYEDEEDCSRTDQIDEDAAEATPPSPSQLWYIFSVACEDQSKTQSMVDSLLHFVDPEMDVDGFLLRMGDPAQKVTIEEKEDLRCKLRTVLFPEYDFLQ